jgi:hypothetical protein
VECETYDRLLAAYITAAEKFSQAAIILSDATGKPSFNDCLEKSDQARTTCRAAFYAMKHHRSKHGCRGGVESSPEANLCPGAHVLD